MINTWFGLLSLGGIVNAEDAVLAPCSDKQRKELATNSQVYITVNGRKGVTQQMIYDTYYEGSAPCLLPTCTKEEETDTLINGCTALGPVGEMEQTIMVDTGMLERADVDAQQRAKVLHQIGGKMRKDANKLFEMQQSDNLDVMKPLVSYQILDESEVVGDVVRTGIASAGGDLSKLVAAEDAISELEATLETTAPVFVVFSSSMSSAANVDLAEELNLLACDSAARVYPDLIKLNLDSIEREVTS